MIFNTHIQGIPCQCEVLAYYPEEPMRITGSGWGDAIEAEPEEFEFRILDRKGYPAKWLEDKLDKDDPDRLLREYLTECLAYQDY